MYQSQPYKTVYDQLIEVYAKRVLSDIINQQAKTKKLTLPNVVSSIEFKGKVRNISTVATTRYELIQAYSQKLVLGSLIPIDTIYQDIDLVVTKLINTIANS